MDKERQMSILTLQWKLCQEIEKITADMRMKQPGKAELTAPRVFAQNLPIPQRNGWEVSGGDTDIPVEESEYGIGYEFPWIVAKIDLGIVSAPSKTQKVNVILVIGAFCDDSDAAGHEQIIIIMERIMERFSKNPLLGGQLLAVPIDDDHMFRWSLQDEDTHPHYFGALEMAFEMPGFEREDQYGYA